MNSWTKLKNTFQGKNRDLDAEFEQFLNESLSEESVSSPRNVKTPRGKKKLPGSEGTTGVASGSKPWWESSVDDESSKDYNTAAQNWFKKTAAVKEEDEITEGDDKTNNKELVPKEIEHGHHDEKLDVQETGVSVTMSKDSLDDGTKAEKEQSPDEDVSDRHDSIKTALNEDSNVENYDYTEPSSSSGTHSSGNDNSQRGTEVNVYQNTVETLGGSDTEMNTLKEMEEKREFFKNLEGESSLDYGKLNKILDENTTMTGKDTSRVDDVLQATGAELGNSIFNTTGVAGAIPRVTNDQDDAALSPNKGTVKPSMLSKVSLMDSLESSMGTAQRQKIKQIRKRQIDLPEEPSETEISSVHEATRRDDDKEFSINVDSEDDHDMVEVDEDGGGGSGGRTSAGNVFLNTSAANELAQLQQALKDAQMTTTQNTREFKEKIQDIGSPNDDTGSPTDVDNTPHMMSHKPVIAANEVDSQGLSYSPPFSIPGLNRTYMPPSPAAMEQQGILIPRENQPDKPVLDQLDLLQAAQSRFKFDQELPEKSEVDQIEHKQKFDQDENFGFSLRPAVEANAAVTSDEDTPPLESLKGIKSIAKKRRQDLTSSSTAEHRKPTPKVSAGKASSKAGKRADVVTKRGAAKTRKDGGGGGGGSRDVNRFGWSTGSGTNTSSKGQRATPVKDERRKTPKKQPNVDQKATSPAQLMASVENFANYLNTFVHRGADDVTGKQRSDWSNDNGDYSPTNEIAAQRLVREQCLQREVERWQCMWQEERKEKEKLVDELINKDKEWKRREQALSLEYKKEINDLKQKIFVMETKLKDANLESDKKKRVVKGGNLKALTDEELQRLEKEILDQEQLLSGYQQESERLCQVLKDTQNKNKEVEKQMFKENQKLASEVAALKERLERKEGVFGMSGAAAMGAERIHQLHTQVQVLKTNEQEMRKEIDELERERAQLRNEQKRLVRERDTAVDRADHAEDSNSQVRNELASSHAADVDRLNRKLKWYVENQELLDKDAAMLKKKNEEIAELRDLVERLENERGQTCLEKDRKDKERAMDAKRIQDLERQVREMEQIIKRRYPNSIPALIYAASAAPGEGKPVKVEDSPKKVPNAPSYAFLENRVQKLDRELEEREEDWARSFRALEQKYNAMQLQYEAQIKELDGELHDARDNVASHTRNTRERTTVLEKELSAARDKHDKRTAQMNEEIRQLRQELSEVKASRPKRGRKEPPKGGLAERGMVEELEGRLNELVEECGQKDRLVDELRVTCGQLQRQREEMLADREVEERSKSTQKSLLEKLDLMNVDNRQLRDQISQMSVEMDQQRVRYQGSLAEVERIARQEREASHDELRTLRTQHKQELDDVRADFAAQHSRSKMSELTSKIASLEIVIERLKDKLAKSAEIEADFASKKLSEEVLKQEVLQLKSALKKAKQCHSPEMQHYAELEEKIVAMETRHARREQDLQAMIGKLRTTADLEKDEVLAKWRGLLRKKTEETERFRVELDSILTVLDELRRQGIVVPLQNVQNIR